MSFWVFVAGVLSQLIGDRSRRSWTAAVSRRRLQQVDACISLAGHSHDQHAVFSQSSRAVCTRCMWLHVRPVLGAVWSTVNLPRSARRDHGRRESAGTPTAAGPVTSQNGLKTKQPRGNVRTAASLFISGISSFNNNASQECACTSRRLLFTTALMWLLMLISVSMATLPV